MLIKVWNNAHVLQDDSVGYGDFVEQITYLIFLKMADEREKAGVPPQSSPGGEEVMECLKKYAWASLVKLDVDEPTVTYLAERVGELLKLT